MTADFLIIGQGLAGTALAWQLLWRGRSVCVLDREAAVTSSRVAAGLITPITGQRLAKTWRLDDLWSAAVAFYNRVEAETGDRFFHRCRNVRLFRDADERALYESRRAFFGEWARNPEPEVNPDWFAAPHGGFEMPTAAQLATDAYLEASRAVFTHKGCYRRCDVDPASDIEVSADGVTIPRIGVRAGRLVFCQGHDAVTNPWFRAVHFGGVKGEILTLRIPGLVEERVVSGGVWLLPLGAGVFRAGSTFDRDVLDCVPTDRGRKEICARLKVFLKLPFEVIDHRAAVRPVIDAGRPMLGMHLECDRIGFFNGLGSKGAVQAPYFAAQLAEALLGQGKVDSTVRLMPDVELPSKGRLTQQSHEAVREVLRPGEVAIDATAGNGHDTRFLADRVGPAGTVFAFEIQPDARARLRERFRESENVVLLGDHAELANALPTQYRGQLGAAMFNLGYLPGGDRSITTQVEVSVPATRTALEWLRPGAAS